MLLTNDQAFAITDSELENLEAMVDASALEELRDTGTPSLQIAIGIGNDIVYESAFGKADLENEVIATPKTKYRTASIAKWFTAVAALRLAENGRVDLDAPVQKYCPHYPTKPHVITTRQLLTQTSGIRHYRDYAAEIKTTENKEEKAALERQMMQETLNTYTRYTDVVTPLESFKDDPLLFNPGEGWEYTSFGYRLSAIGYRLLACVLQGATEKPYVDLMADIVFAPAGMKDTVPDDAWAIIPHRASGYRLENGNLRRADFRDVSENLPAGGYLSTATDLVRFTMAFDNGLVSEQTVVLMASPVAADLDRDSELSWRDAIPQADKYGYGLMLFSKYSDGMVGHTGRQAGSSAILVLFPETNVSIAVLTNAKGWNGYLGFVMKLKGIVDEHVN